MVAVDEAEDEVVEKIINVTSVIDLAILHVNVVSRMIVATSATKLDTLQGTVIRR